MWLRSSSSVVSRLEIVCELFSRRQAMKEHKHGGSVADRLSSWPSDFLKHSCESDGPVTATAERGGASGTL